jgi:hypothetical protein
MRRVAMISMIAHPVLIAVLFSTEAVSQEAVEQQENGVKNEIAEQPAPTSNDAEQSADESGPTASAEGPPDEAKEKSETGAKDPASNPPKVEPLKNDLNTRLVGAWRSEIFMSQRAVMRDLGDGRYGQRPLNVYPFYNTIYLSAEEVGRRGLSIHFQGWAGLDLADVYFDQRFVADPTYFYIQFRDFGLDVRAGRQMVFSGAARGLHIDGLNISYQTPFYLGIQALGGLVVSPKLGPDWYNGETADSFDDYGAGFSDWRREMAFGDFAVGGRVFYRLAGRFSAGVSILHKTRDLKVDQQLGGADLDIAMFKWAALSGDALMSIPETTLKEANAALDFYPVDFFSFSVDYRHADPTLFISSMSIFSVFSDEKYDSVGGALSIFPVEWLTLHGGYHQRFYRYIVDISPEDSSENVYGQGIDLGYEALGGINAHFKKTGILALVEFRRFKQDITGMNQFRLSGGFPIFETGLTTTANAYVDLYDDLFLDRSIGLLGDLGLHWARGDWGVGGAITSGLTPYARHEIGGMIKVTYNLELSFVDRRQP